MEPERTDNVATLPVRPQSEPPREMRGLVLIIHYVVHCVVLVVWSVVGFLLWVPFLTRMILVFTGAVITTIYKNTDPTKAQKGLEAGVRFYIHGFELILASMRNELARDRVFEEASEIGLFKVLVEVAIAIVFWAGITLTWVYLFSHGIGSMRSLMEQPKENVTVLTATPPAAPAATPSPLSAEDREGIRVG